MNIEETLERAIEYHKYNWLEEAEKLYRAVLTEEPDHPDVHYYLGQLAMQVNKPETAVLFFEKALRADPRSLLRQQSLSDAKVKLTTMLSTDQHAESPIFEPKGTDYILERKIQSLENKLFGLNEKLDRMHEALSYLDIFTMKKFGDSSSRMLPVELIDKKASKTLVAFGGMTSGLSLPPKEFFKSLIDRNINIVFVKDFKQCWYQQGLLGKTDDINSSILYLMNLVPKTTNELITIGASSGGYAAIRFGLGLKADRILAFSPQTLIDEEMVRVFSKHRLKDMDFNSDELDLRKVLEKHPEQPCIEVYYGQHNNRDRKSAEHIKEYINEFHYDTDDHMIAAFLKRRGILKEILESI